MRYVSLSNKRLLIEPTKGKISHCWICYFVFCTEIYYHSVLQGNKRARETVEFDSTIIGLCRGLSTDCLSKGPRLNYFSSISSSLLLFMGWSPATTVQFSHAILSSIHYWPRHLKARLCHRYDEVIIIVACAGIRLLCVRYAICGLFSTNVLFIYIRCFLWL